MTPLYNLNRNTYIDITPLNFEYKTGEKIKTVLFETVDGTHARCKCADGSVLYLKPTQKVLTV